MVVAGIEDTQPQILSLDKGVGGNSIRVSSVSRVVWFLRRSEKMAKTNTRKKEMKRKILRKM